MTLRAYTDMNNGYYQVDLPIGAPDPDWAKGMTPCPVQYRPPAIPTPNVVGFQNAVKLAVGGIIGANTLATTYPLLSPAIEQEVWADVQALIIDAQTRLIITATQYGDIKNAAATYAIPIVLP